MFGPNRSLTTVTTSCEAGLIWSGNFTHGGGLNEIVEHSNSSPITFAVNRLQNSYGISTVGGIFLPRESTRFNVWLRSAFKLPIDFHQVKRFLTTGRWRRVVVEVCYSFYQLHMTQGILRHERQLPGGSTRLWFSSAANIVPMPLKKSRIFKNNYES